MVCSKCGGDWAVKRYDGRLHQVCKKCGFVDMRSGTVDGVPVGPDSPEVGLVNYVVTEEQRKEIDRLKKRLTMFDGRGMVAVVVVAVVALFVGWMSGWNFDSRGPGEGIFAFVASVVALFAYLLFRRSEGDSDEDNSDEGDL